MKQTLHQLLAQRKPILYDGATGTFLQELGLPIGVAPEAWVLNDPARVYTAAEAYVNAGAQIILTCTFGGTAVRLLEAGLDARAFELNRHAAELAREAAGERALVAGSMGPLGRMQIAMGALTYADAVDQFADQATALAEGGVDLLQIESMSDRQEMKAAIEGARRVTDLPIFATMSFDTAGRTLLGVTPTIAARELVELKVNAIGANCGRSPEDMVALLREMRRAAPVMPLIAKPNAGIPEIRAGKAVYSITPEQFAAHARDWIRATAKIVGGCCGTTPAHIAAMRAVISQSGN
jgi:5-methyltetrahydrofolate--homocysteine methyltransferase